MRRVQSSIHGVSAGAGPTVVLQPASPAAEGSCFGRRRRSSLVFTPCPPDTPTRTNSAFKVQRAASSCCSATGWDYAPVVALFAGEDDVSRGPEVALDQFKASQQQLFNRSFNRAADEVENQRSWGSEADDCVSCFVAAPSPARRGARSFAELASALSPPLAPIVTPVAAHEQLADAAAVNSRGEPQPSSKWLGAELARQAQPVPPPSPRGGGASPRSQRLYGGLAAGMEFPGAESRVFGGLRRTRRIWEGMDMLVE